MPTEAKRKLLAIKYLISKMLLKVRVNSLFYYALFSLIISARAFGLLAKPQKHKRVRKLLSLRKPESSRKAFAYKFESLSM